MAKQWYYMKGQQQFGPISWRDLYLAAQAGTVSLDDLVWVEGLKEWTPASDIKGLIAQPPAAVPPAPSPTTPSVSPPPPPQEAAAVPHYPETSPLPPLPGSVPVPPIQTVATLPPLPVIASMPPVTVAAPEPPASWQPTATPQLHPEGFQGNDKIVGIIPAMQCKTGMFSVKTYNLVLTEQSIIFAEATAQMFKQAASDAAAEAQSEGKGFFARAADTMRSSQRIYQKYWQMVPEAIINETVGNFAIDYREIASIKIVRQGWLKVGVVQDDHDHQKKDEMHIKTGRETIKLTFEHGNSNEAKNILQGLLGEKIR